MEFTTANDNNFIPLPWSRVWVVLNYDTSYANAKAGDTIMVPKRRALIWLNRGWARQADAEEVKVAALERQNARKAISGCGEFERLWLTEEELCSA